MKPDYTNPKELEELLGIAKRRKADLTADFKSAQRAYVMAASGNTTIEYRQELHKKADSIKAELDKPIACIEKIENRLGANSANFSKPDTSHENAAKTITESVQADSEFVSKVNSANNLNKRTGKVLNLLKVQITPSKMCVEPNDSIIKAIFSKHNTQISVKEKHRTKRKNAVVSNLNVHGAALSLPQLDEFDRAVLGVIVSEQNIGNRYTTVNIIHRALIGRPGQGLKGFYPEKDQRNAIINSVSKLMGTVVDFSGVNDSLKKLKYSDKDGNEISFKLENLLSAGVFDAKVNGQPVDDVIYFKDSCPLFDIANLKDQVIRYPHELLNVPKQNNTPLVISLKKYVMRRICEIKLHPKQLKPTITFDDIFSKCKLQNAGKKKKFDARNVIIKFFEHLKAQNFITDFEVKKERGKFSKIAVSFGPSRIGGYSD